jgi:membrane-associated protease RseP (regulator of RpoE activity)
MKSFSFFLGLLLCLGWFLCSQLDSQSRTPGLLLIQSGTIGIRGNIVFHLTEVGAGNPAERAGLRPNDLILRIDGRRLRGDEDVKATILDSIKPPGEVYTTEYLRPVSETQRYRV